MKKTKYLSFLINDNNINSEREITIKTKDVIFVKKIAKKERGIENE